MAYKDKQKQAECHKRWRLNNKQHRSDYNFQWFLKSRYNLTFDQYNQFLEKQNYRCANFDCQSLFSKEGNPPHIDHDHSCCPGRISCGKCVRGLLCAGCNVGIGNYEKFLNNSWISGYLNKEKLSDPEFDAVGC